MDGKVLVWGRCDNGKVSVNGRVQNVTPGLFQQLFPSSKIISKNNRPQNVVETIKSCIKIPSEDSQNKLSLTYHPQLMAEFQIMIYYFGFRSVPTNHDNYQFWMSTCWISFHLWFSVFDHHFWSHLPMILKSHVDFHRSCWQNMPSGLIVLTHSPQHAMADHLCYVWPPTSFHAYRTTYQYIIY